MIIRSSLHNPIVTAFPDATFLQRSRPRTGMFQPTGVGKVGNVVWESLVLFQASPEPYFFGGFAVYRG